MTLKTFTFLLISLTILIHSCVDPYYPDVNIIDTQPVLVVLGVISNEDGPFKIRLTQSISLYTDPNQLNQDHPVDGADVYIVDDKGNDFKLNETTFGWYETDDKHLKAETGNTYILTVATPDGKQYESSPQYVYEVPDIDTVYYEEEERSHFENEELITENWLNILVNSDPSPEKDVYLRWETVETWEFHMPAEILVDHGPPSSVSGSYEPPSWETVTIDEENTEICWITKPTMKILVSSTVGYKDRKVTHFTLQSIGPPSDKLNIRYSILVKQYTINPELFTILKKLRDANVETAGLYSKNPGQIFGNITCCDGGGKALGYFSASAVTSKRIFIMPGDHDIVRGSAYGGCGWTTSPPNGVRLFLYGNYGGSSVWSDNRYCVDCTARGTKEKPDFW